MSSRAARLLVVALCLGWSFALPARAEVLHEELASSMLDANAPVIRSPHLTARDPEASSRHLLAIYLPGTGGTANSEGPFIDVLAHAGYHAISLDYPNSVTAAVFRPSRDSRAFDHYRQALMFGGRVNESLSVAPASSIASRISALLLHLAATRGADGWSEFVTGQAVQWSKLVLIGHSQGAGHAAYLAQHRRVHKVLIIAGPQDYLTTLHMPAPWLGAASRTPRSRLRTLLHREDEYDSRLQLASNRALHRSSAPPVVFRDRPPSTPRAPAIALSERPLTRAESEDKASTPGRPVAHISLVTSAYAEVWLYLLDH